MPKGIRLRKRLGQHLMTDPHSLQKIVEAADVGPGDQIIEVGTGTGALTELLASRAARVLTVEIDRRLQEIAQKNLHIFENIVWILGDILKLPHDTLKKSLGHSTTLKVVSNPPYSISTPLLQYFLEWKPKPERLVFTFQKEVVDRIRAKPGTKTYGSLSLFAQYFFDVEVAGRVPPSAFFPPPQVDSSIVVLRPRSEPRLRPEVEAIFFKIVRAVFQQRRKILLNALRSAFPHLNPEILTATMAPLGIHPSIRGEKLSLPEYIGLAEKLANRG